MPSTWSVTQSPLIATCWAALACVASASSRSDGAKSAAKWTARKTRSSNDQVLTGEESRVGFSGVVSSCLMASGVIIEIIWPNNHDISMRSTSGKPTVSAERARLQQLTTALKANLEACADNPEVEAVHNVRTGTRRIEAMLDSVLRERVPPGSGLNDEKTSDLLKAAEKWLRLLKRI